MGSWGTYSWVGTVKIDVGKCFEGEMECPCSIGMRARNEP